MIREVGYGHLAVHPRSTYDITAEDCQFHQLEAWTTSVQACLTQQTWQRPMPLYRGLQGLDSLDNRPPPFQGRWQLHSPRDWTSNFLYTKGSLVIFGLMRESGMTRYVWQWRLLFVSKADKLWQYTSTGKEPIILMSYAPPLTCKS